MSDSLFICRSPSINGVRVREVRKEPISKAKVVAISAGFLSAGFGIGAAIAFGCHSDYTAHALLILTGIALLVCILALITLGLQRKKEQENPFSSPIADVFEDDEETIMEAVAERDTILHVNSDVHGLDLPYRRRTDSASNVQARINLMQQPFSLGEGEGDQAAIPAEWLPYCDPQILSRDMVLALHYSFSQKGKERYFAVAYSQGVLFNFSPDGTSLEISCFAQEVQGEGKRETVGEPFPMRIRVNDIGLPNERWQVECVEQV